MTKIATDGVLTVKLGQPATDMAQEEMRKQFVFLHQGIREISFSEDGCEVTFQARGAEANELSEKVRGVATRIQLGLRQLKRKIVFTSSRVANPVFTPVSKLPGVEAIDSGIVVLDGLSLALFNYFNRVFTEFGRMWNPMPLRTPTLIPSRVLAKCDYFRSFPHNVTFATHLIEDAANIEGFRVRYKEANELDVHAMGHMEIPKACLSPAVCYHAYYINRERTIPREGLTYEVCGKCFRYEASNMADLRRLWDFTMREVVFLGAREPLLGKRQKSMAMMSDFLEQHELAGEIRTASDPFFVAPDAVSKTYFQLSSETKFEVSLLLPNEERLAVGSHNYHSDFFGRAFETKVEGEDGAMHSVCVAFGLERWVYGFFQQHGVDVTKWPDLVKGAPEFK